MAGHSKWHNIQHKKSIEDKKKGKIFTKHAKLIASAARNGADPDTNAVLRAAIDNARAVNMPRENIERAIKKGSGEGKDAAQMEEVFYEGFGPGGVALYIEALTDNKNRTVTNIKNILHKCGGNLGAVGSVGYLFQKIGIIVVPFNSDLGLQNREVLELSAIDAGASDLKHHEAFMEVYTAPQELMEVKKNLEDKGVTVESASLSYIPSTKVKITDEEIAKKLLKIMNTLEEDDDISTVYHNFEIAEEIEKKAL